MSASNKKKLRKQEAEAQMSNRQAAAAKEAKKQKMMTRTFWIVIVLCFCIFLGSLLASPVQNWRYTRKDAVEVGNHTINAVELNYFYVDAINTFYSNYQSYISYLMDVNAPLNEQITDAATGETWADYFVNQAYNNIKNTYAVYDAAMAAGFTLDETAQANVDTTVSYLELYAMLYGFKNADAYLRNMYGAGATVESYTEYYTKCAIAEAYYAKYAEDLEYTIDELTAYQSNKIHDFNSYDFATYYLAVSRFYPKDAGTKDANGKITYTQEEIDAAVKAAKEAAELLASGDYKTVEEFDKAINELDVNKPTTTDKDKEENKAETQTVEEEENTEEGTTEDEGTTEEDKTEGEGSTEDGKTEEKEEELKYKSTKYEDTLFSNVNALFQDFVIGKIGVNEDGEPTLVKRKSGDMKVIEYSSGTGDDKTINGFYVVRYESTTNNEFAMKNVRHILVKFVKLDSNGKPTTSTSSSNSSTVTYTDAEKKYAKDEAEKLLAEWEKGDKTEDSFAELANKESDDGDGTTGGLYENIYPGQMVDNFEDWCYDAARKAGDVEIIETEYGYHIMYFVGNTEQTYRNYLIQETMRAEDTQEWYTALVEAIPFTALSDKFVNKEMTING